MIHATESALLDRLVTAFRESGGIPVLPAEDLPLARSLLFRLIVDHETLEEYLARVRDSLSGDGLLPDVAYEAQCSQVVDRGLEAAEDTTVARILLDPPAVVNLHMAVDLETPEHWRQALAENGREILRQNGLPTHFGPVPSSEAVTPVTQ